MSKFILFTSRRDYGDHPCLQASFGELWDKFSGKHPILFVGRNWQPSTPEGADIFVIWEPDYGDGDYEDDEQENINNQLTKIFNNTNEKVYYALHAHSDNLHQTQQDLIISVVREGFLYDKYKTYSHDPRICNCYRKFAEAVQAARDGKGYNDAILALEELFIPIFEPAISILMWLLPAYLTEPDKAVEACEIAGKTNKDIIKLTKDLSKNFNEKFKENETVLNEIKQLTDKAKSLIEKCNQNENVLNEIKQLTDKGKSLTVNFKDKEAAIAWECLMAVFAEVLAEGCTAVRANQAYKQLLRLSKRLEEVENALTKIQQVTNQAKALTLNWSEQGYLELRNLMISNVLRRV